MKIRCLPCPASALIVQVRVQAQFSCIHTRALTAKSGFCTMKYWNIHHLQAHSEDTGVNGKSSCRLYRAPVWHLSGDTYTKHCKHSHLQWISGGWADFQLTNERICFLYVREPHGRWLIFNKGALRPRYTILSWNSSWVLTSETSLSRWEESKPKPIPDLRLFLQACQAVTEFLSTYGGNRCLHVCPTLRTQTPSPSWLQWMHPKSGVMTGHKKEWEKVVSLKKTCLCMSWQVCGSAVWIPKSSGKGM